MNPKTPEPMPAPLTRDEHRPLKRLHPGDERVNDGERKPPKSGPGVRWSAREDAAAVEAAESLHDERRSIAFEIATYSAVAPNPEASASTTRTNPVEIMALLGYLLEADVLAANHRCREARSAPKRLRASPFHAAKLSIEPYRGWVRKARHCRRKIQRSERFWGVYDPRNLRTSQPFL